MGFLSSLTAGKGRCGLRQSSGAEVVLCWIWGGNGGREGTPRDVSLLSVGRFGAPQKAGICCFLRSCVSCRKSQRCLGRCRALWPCAEPRAGCWGGLALLLVLCLPLIRCPSPSLSAWNAKQIVLGSAASVAVYHREGQKEKCLF